MHSDVVQTYRATIVQMIYRACASIITAAVIGFSATGWAASSEQASPVYATVNGHQITEQQVDDAVLRNVSPPQLYDLRKQALDELVDNYLIDQAAKKAGLTHDQYLAREIDHQQITDAEARQFFDQHKDAIESQTKNAPFDQVKGRIIAVLEREKDKDQREALMTKLRAGNHVNIMLQPSRESVATAGAPWSGGDHAPVTVVEFSDFQCPYCRAAESSVKQIRNQYGDKIKFVYLDFPLGFHEHALDAARAASCAGQQDKFWQYHDALFADQSKLAAADLKATAAKLGLNTKKFDTCFDAKQPDPAIHSQQAQGESLGVTGTPTFFINGRELVGAQPANKFSQVIDEEIANAKSPNREQASNTN
jgi:protein-disulfide isomerase